MDEAEEGSNRLLIGVAADWLAALDSGSVSREAFEAWRNADPCHALAFAEVSARWQQLGQLPNLAIPTVRAEPPQAAQPDRRQFLARAASVAALLATGGGAVFLWKGRGHEVTTAVGERRTIPLPDGSSIELNTDSRLRWAFGHERTVWLLQGEAALTIAMDAARPFVVHAADAVAHLAQGRFNLRLDGRDAAFIALAGLGQVSAGRADLALAPGQSVSAADGTAHHRAIDTATANDLTAWRNGEIVLDGMSLDQAVSEFNRYLARKLVVGDAALGALRLGGRFHIDDPRSFLQALKASFDIDARAEGSVLLLSRP